MLTGKDLDNKLEIEKFIDDYISLYFSRIDLADYQYLDEIYTSIATKIEKINQIGSINYTPIDEYDFVEENVFQNFIDDYTTLSVINYKMVPEIFTGFQKISDNILDIANTINKVTYESSTLLKEVEEEIKNKLLRKSIKEESTIYDSLGPGSQFSSTVTGVTPNSLKDLTIDEQSRSITLPIGNMIEIPFEIEIECNKDKGIYMPPAFGASTFESITNGYFYSRMFAVRPELEIEELDGDIENIKDNDPETGVMIEYNSFADYETLEVKYKLSFEDTRVDTIRIIFHPLGTESTTGMSNIYPFLDTLQIENNDPDNPVSENMTVRVTDNTININGRKIGEYNSSIQYCGDSIFPTAAYTINSKEINNILLSYRLPSPQEIYYLEKCIYNSNNDETYRFNYFETLVLNNYIVPQNRKSTNGEEVASDPYSYYDTNDIAEMMEIINSAYRVSDQKVKLFRYMIGVKDIRLYKSSYIPTGSLSTGNLLPKDTTAAAVELYVNEIIDDETSITYYLSNNNSTWVEIIPSNRVTTSPRGKRVTFDGFDPRTGDVVVEGSCTSLYLKVEMKGTQSKTPILNAYSLKVKYI